MNFVVPPGIFMLALICAAPLLAIPARGAANQKLKVAVVNNDSEGPRYMSEGGLLPMLDKLGCEVKSLDTAALTKDEQAEYGAWNHDALASRRIGELVSRNREGEALVLGLLKNCTDLLGMLAGLQHLQPAGAGGEPGAAADKRAGLAGIKPLRVGLVYFDAHADFNTPETTLSGMLGGMDVAVACGLCLTRLRGKAGLDPALPTRYVVFGGLRDVDPLERELLDRSECEYLSVKDVRTAGEAIDVQMRRLGGLADVIYVHVDMDVVDPSEVSGHPLTAPEGPTSAELASTIRKIFSYPKAAALGIASIPYGDRDKDGVSLRAAYRLIEASVLGMRSRPDD